MNPLTIEYIQEEHLKEDRQILQASPSNAFIISLLGQGFVDEGSTLQKERGIRSIPWCFATRSFPVESMACTPLNNNQQKVKLPN